MGIALPGESREYRAARDRLLGQEIELRRATEAVAAARRGLPPGGRVARDYVLEQMERHGAVAGWIVDDTGIPKKGRHSVGVVRQYCGVLGKQDNCQVAVTVTLANEAVSVPAAYRLYLPEVWANDRRHRKEAVVPEQVTFKTKWQIALDEIVRMHDEGLPLAPVVADAGFGVVTAFRDALTEQGIPYMVGISGETTVWRPGTEPLRPRAYRGLGRPPKLIRRTKSRRPVSIRALAEALPTSAWQTITWRQGTRGPMRSRFACLRVRPAHRDELRHHAREVEWLIVEWPRGEAAPTKSWLSTLPDDTPREQLIRLAKLRWRIERDYEELKQEIGLDHFEGRGWRGFHHHGVLCIAAYAFLAAERARLSPPEPLSFLRAAPLPRGFKARGSSDSSRTAHPRVDRHDASSTQQGSATPSTLRVVRKRAAGQTPFVTQ